MGEFETQIWDFWNIVDEPLSFKSCSKNNDGIFWYKL